ncbi:Xylose isomerase-like TIM barrel [uncultured archaeon]|nr:Xylose isomerase-like TIM barrel [uncultured archaeon]
MAFRSADRRIIKDLTDLLFEEHFPSASCQALWIAKIQFDLFPASSRSPWGILPAISDLWANEKLETEFMNKAEYIKSKGSRHCNPPCLSLCASVTMFKYCRLTTCLPSGVQFAKMTMKLGISTWAFQNLSMAEALARISQLSDRAEILCEARHSLLRPENLEALPSFSLKFTVHGLVADINIASIYPEFREASVKLHRRAIEASALAGAELYIIHPGYTAWSFCWQEALQALDQSLAELGALQEELGICLAVENMPRTPEFMNR